MIYLVTGTPGAGKTLFTISGLYEEMKDIPLESRRTVYYYKITLLPPGLENLPNWVEASKEDIQNWSSFPDGSIFLVDEAHTVFPQRGATSKVPQFIEDLAEHRHRGMDFYIIDQHPRDIDIFIRRRCYQHWHWLNVFGMDSSTKLAWQGFLDDQPDDYHARSRAEKTRHKFPKKVFGWYQSATVHTKKRRVPWQLYAIPLGVLAAFLLGWLAYSNLTASDSSVPDPSPSAVSPPPPPGPVPVSVSGGVQRMPSPVNRVIYQDFRNSLIPPYFFKVQTIYLDSVWEVGAAKGSSYEIIDSEGNVIPVTNSLIVASGGVIRVVDSKCTHQIIFPSFDLWTVCRPPVQDSDVPVGDSDSSPDVPSSFIPDTLQTVSAASSSSPLSSRAD